MFISTRYIFKQLLFTTFVVMAVVSLTVWLTQTLRFTEVVAQKGLPIASLVKLSLLIIPEVFTGLLPFGFLLGVLFIFYRMEGDNELVVLKATGQSNMRISYPVIYAGLLLGSILAVLTLVIVPHTNRQFVYAYHKLRNTTPTFYVQDRQFINFDNYTVYIRKAQEDELLQGLLIHDKRKDGSTITAREGAFQRKAGKLQMTLYDGVRYETDPKTGKPALLTFQQYDVVLGNRSTTKGSAKVSVQSQPTLKLLNYSHEYRPYFSRKQAFAELHKRALGPLLLVLFGLTASACMLLGPSRRNQRYGKAFVAILFALVSQVLLMAVLGFAKRHFWWGAVAYVLVGTMIFCSVLVLRGWLAQRLKGILR